MIQILFRCRSSEKKHPSDDTETGEWEIKNDKDILIKPREHTFSKNDSTYFHINFFFLFSILAIHFDQKTLVSHYEKN